MKSSTDPGVPGRRGRLLFPVLFVALGLAVVELGLQLARAALNWGKLPNRQYLLSPYQGQAWARPLYEEMLATGYQYDPLLSFRERPFAGRYVNIDEQGLRRTWSPPLPDTPAPSSIYVFGGSTVWGWGARDDHTIPSELARYLSERGAPRRVVNCGQKGYTFTQELLLLVRQLRQGARPDLVVFCDGFNDVFFSYRAGRAEVTYEFEENRWRFEAKDLALASRSLARWVKEHSATVRTAVKISEQAGLKERTRYGTVAPEYSDQALADLARAIVEDRLRSLDLLDHLASAYGFRYECFWQPVIFYEERLTPEESGIGPAPGDRTLGVLFARTREQLNARRPPHLHDAADALRGRTATVYLDFAHVSEPGNQLVAAKIGGILLGEGGVEQARDHR